MKRETKLREKILGVLEKPLERSEQSCIWDLCINSTTNCKL